MCGICGFVYLDHERPAPPEFIRRMRQSITHRGPDDGGEHFDGNVGLGFNRLSIIDVAGGHQPLSNEDGTVWIVFNGEIYNFGELRDELIRRGHRFRTRSDTETIVHGWEEYGEKVVDKLRGMFAFAIWDSRQRCLFIARDRLGIKPLYYYLDRDFFAFGSELKALAALPDIQLELNTDAVGDFLRHRYVLGPQTMLAGIQKLDPGHTLRLDGSDVTIRRYWDLPTEPPKPIKEGEAEEQLDALLRECVKSHLISDVPLGAFLSGGLDSSSIVGLMSSLGVEKIRTFSVGYDDDRESELGYAKVIADHFKTEHHELKLAPADFRDFLPTMVWHMDEPVGDEASIPLFYISQFARKHVTVALSGEGSDEIFGGYDIYRRMLTFEKLNRLPLAGAAGSLLQRLFPQGRVNKYAGMLGKSLESRYRGVSRVFGELELARLQNDSVAMAPLSERFASAYRRSQHLEPLARMAYVDINTWLLEDLLVKADRMSMANSLELRVPFLDHKLVEFGFQLPEHLKLRGGSGKFLLKKCMSRLLPQQIVHRTKRGFPVPVRSWFRNDLAGYAQETLLDSNSTVCGLLEKAELKRVLASHQSGQDRSAQIYPLLVFEHWCKQFLIKRPESGDLSRDRALAIR